MIAAIALVILLTHVLADRTAFAETPDLYVLNDRGEEIERITNNKEVESRGTWSPDGMEIVYSSYNDSRARLFLYNFSTRTTEPLFGQEYDCHDPAWHPSQRLIAYASNRRGNLDVYVQEVGADHARCLTCEGEGDLDSFLPAWSSDGEKLAYASRGRDSNEWYCTVVSLRTGKSEVVYQGTSTCLSPVWVDKDRYILFSSFEDSSQGNALKRVRLESGEVEQLSIRNVPASEYNMAADWEELWNADRCPARGRYLTYVEPANSIATSLCLLPFTDPNIYLVDDTGQASVLHADTLKMMPPKQSYTMPAYSRARNQYLVSTHVDRRSSSTSLTFNRRKEIGAKLKAMGEVVAVAVLGLHGELLITERHGAGMEDLVWIYAKGNTLRGSRSARDAGEQTLFTVSGTGEVTWHRTAPDSRLKKWSVAHWPTGGPSDALQIPAVGTVLLQDSAKYKAEAHATDVNWMLPLDSGALFFPPKGVPPPPIHARISRTPDGMEIRKNGKGWEGLILKVDGTSRAIAFKDSTFAPAQCEDGCFWPYESDTGEVCLPIRGSVVGFAEDERARVTVPDEAERVR